MQEEIKTVILLEMDITVYLINSPCSNIDHNCTINLRNFLNYYEHVNLKIYLLVGTIFVNNLAKKKTTNTSLHALITLLTPQDYGI